VESTESAPAPGLSIETGAPLAACQSKHMSSWEAPAPPASAAALEPFAPEVWVYIVSSPESKMEIPVQIDPFQPRWLT
jgi:hypothetical protein